MIDKDPRFRNSLAFVFYFCLLLYWSFSGFFGKEIISEVAIFSILAMSLDLMAGYTGMVSLAHGALFGIGAYLFAWASSILGYPLWMASLICLGLSGFISFIFGLLTVRLKGIYFIMITLAFGSMAYEFFFKNKTLGGDDGFSGIARMEFKLDFFDLADPTYFSLLLIVISAIVYIALNRVVGSPFGAALIGIKINEKRMQALGLNSSYHKIKAFVISGMLASFAGILFAQHHQFISPDMLHWTTSGEILVMVILGGLGSLVGPLLGATIVIFLRHELSGITDYWNTWLGAMLIGVVVSGKPGIIGWMFWVRDWFFDTYKISQDDSIETERE